MSDTGLALLLLHALPLDGSMWAAQMKILPGSTYAPNLYSAGTQIGKWAATALDVPKEDRLVVVGCSVGGSCALEVAAKAPDRVAALVLIGTKAAHRPDPELHAAALQTIRKEGLHKAWETYWEPLLSPTASSGSALALAKDIALRQSPADIAAGVTVFHTRPSRGHVLAEAKFPVIFVTGADDRAPGPNTMADQARLAKRGRLHIIPGCGHYLPLERPDALNAILQEVVAMVLEDEH